uniref:Uncharacterized protein n=1 Tax=Amphimedon queenslandica TaxID=400682 RepID=A0A1X7TF33_AMPQE
MPLANLGHSKTPPLVLPSPLPLVLGKVVEAIRLGTSVDFRDLLMDNSYPMTEGHRLWTAERPFSLPEIGDVETWLHCPLTFGAAKVNYQGSGELMAYGQIILNRLGS